MEAAHMKSVDELLKYFKVSDTEGLSQEVVEESLEKYGLNGKQLFTLFDIKEKLNIFVSNLHHIEMIH